MYAIPFDLVVANTKDDHPKASLRPTRISVPAGSDFRGFMKQH